MKRRPPTKSPIKRSTVALLALLLSLAHAAESRPLGEHKAREQNTLDVQVSAILSPRGMIRLGSTFVPRASICNPGLSQAIFPVKFDIGTEYSSTVLCTLAAGQTKTITFPSWTPARHGLHLARCSTQLTGDLAPANDCLIESTYVEVRDAEVVNLAAPRGIVNVGARVVPEATVSNLGNTKVCIPVRLEVSDGYTSRRMTDSLPPDARATLRFDDWIPRRAGDLVAKCSTELEGDLLPLNDYATSRLLARVLDGELLSIETPKDTLWLGSTILPRIRVRNGGTSSGLFVTHLSIGTEYADSQTCSLAVGAEASIAFRPWTSAQPGMSRVCARIVLPGDADPSNDELTDSVFVRYCDVRLLRTSLTRLTPRLSDSVVLQAFVLNEGNTPTDLGIFLSVANNLSWTRSAAAIAPGCSTWVSLASWQVDRVGWLPIACSVHVAHDAAPENNRIVDSIFVQKLDVEVVSIDLSTPTAGHGQTTAVAHRSTVTPRATLRNCGNTAAYFPVQLEIGPDYSFTRSCTLDFGATKVVSFPVWTALTPGKNLVHCRALLQEDENPQNNSCTSEVFVQLSDVQVV
ncbi:MAG: hypothetical protein ABIK62_00460, partial [candidate division WOR-3 bacterium]